MLALLARGAPLVAKAQQLGKALAGDLTVGSTLAALGVAIFGGGLLGWALLQTTLEEAQPDAQVSFMKRHPCPVNDNTRGPCPGYAVSLIQPLCAGGSDRASNMQWLAVAEAKKKDRLDAQKCRAYRKQKRT